MAKKKSPPKHKMVAMPAHSETNWAAREDLHTMKRAHEIMSDPKRHAAAKDMARTEVHHLKKVAGRKA